MKIIFFATAEFAIDSLIASAQQEEVVAVVTQPDKPKGRGLLLASPPIKEAAVKLNLRVFQPSTPITIVNELRKLSPDLIIVCAYGKILKQEIINLSKVASICIHPSLLPKYRGASPINYAIINGEKVTGVTIFFITEQLDAGEIIAQKEVLITDDDNYQTLHDRLKIAAKELLLDTIDRLKHNNYSRIKQDDTKATYAPLIKQEDTKINFDNPAAVVYNFIRGLTPYPGCFTYYNNRLVKIHQVELYDDKNLYDEVGKVVDIDKKLGIIVSTKSGSIILKELQPEGKKRMSAIDFVNGYRIKIGDNFG